MHPNAPIAPLLWGIQAKYFYDSLDPVFEETFRSGFSRIAALRPLPSVYRQCLGLTRTHRRLARVLTYISAKRMLGSRPLVKDPYSLMIAPWLQAAFNAKIVIVVRHPAAFVSSLIRMGWEPDIENFIAIAAAANVDAHAFDVLRRFRSGSFTDKGAAVWYMLHTKIADYVTRHPDWCVVRHEDLCMNTDFEFGRVLRYIGLERDNMVLREIDRLKYIDGPAAPPSRISHSKRRALHQVPFQWKTRLSPNAQDAIRRITEPVSSAFYCEADWSTAECPEVM